MNMSKKWHDRDSFHMVYSVGVPKGTPPEHYKTDLHDITTMKQNVMAFAGKCIVVAERDEFWGGGGSMAYRSKPLVDPTWKQLYACAKAQQKRTLDLHHSFFEGAHILRVEKSPNGLVSILRLSLGS